MIIKTTKFGELDIKEEKILIFPKGLFGFQELRRYIILDHDKEAPFKWLQSIDDPDVAFIVIDPTEVKSDYKPNIQREDLSELGIADEKDILFIFSLVTIPHDNPEKITINLQAPLIINLSNRKAKQLILNDEWDMAHPVIMF